MKIYYKANLNDLTIKKIEFDKETKDHLVINGRYIKKEYKTVRYVKSKKDAFKWIRYCLDLKILAANNKLTELTESHNLFVDKYPDLKNDRLDYEL